MSIKYYYKKAFSAAFNQRGSFAKVALVGATAVLAPVYLVGEAILNDASSVRAPVTGDAQAAGLEKSLTTLLTFTRDGQNKMAELNDMRRQQFESAADKTIAGKVTELERQQQSLAGMLEQGKRNFTNSVILNRNISEVDAKSLLSRYQETFGDPDLWSIKGNSPGTIGNHTLSYLDECQAEVMGGNIYPNDQTAQAVDRCMYSAGENRSIGAFMGGVVGGVPLGIALLTLLISRARRYEYDVRDETYARRIKALNEPKKPKTRTDEVNLKIKIEKPKL